MRIWAFPCIYPYPYEGMNWLGIFVHRKYKELIENGAELTSDRTGTLASAIPFFAIAP